MSFLKGKKEVWIGLGILLVLILIIIGIKVITSNGEISERNLTNVYIATGGGKDRPVRLPLPSRSGSGLQGGAHRRRLPDARYRSLHRLQRLQG